MVLQAKTPVSHLDVADRLGRLIALVGKSHIARGNYPRTEAEIARELLALADEHGVVFDKSVRDGLEREAERYRD